MDEHAQLMSALSGAEIRKRLQAADLEHRLVVAPLLEPTEQLKDDQASIDLRLGFDFAFFSPSLYPTIDELPGTELTGHYKRTYLPLGGSLVIHPHQFVLASTLEYIRLPANIMAYVIGRSTWGRLGLIVATAVGVQPGFTGALTLELRNLGETPLTLYPGQVIAQLFFHTVEGATNAGLGQYSGITDIVPRRLSSERTQRKLRALKKKIT